MSRKVSTGRFGYDTDHDDNSKIEADIRRDYENIVETGIALLNRGECCKANVSVLEKATEHWDSMIDAIKEAAELGGADCEAAVLINVHILMMEVLAIGKAIGERKTVRATAKARDKLDRKNPDLPAIARRNILIDAVAAVDLKSIKGSRFKAIAQECRRRGYEIDHEAVRDRLRKGSCQEPARRCQPPSQRRMTEAPF